jgi:hypothetical protein
MAFPWSPGQVLTASALNDEFGAKLTYPSGGADGDALIKSGTSAAWGAAGGLTLITSESFTAVSSLTISNCFSATYDNYVITMQANGLVSAQLRTGSTTATANYDDQFLQVNDTTFTQGARTSRSDALFAGATGENWHSITHMFRPAVAVATSWVTQNTLTTFTNFLNYTARHSTATAYQSLVLTVGAGTMTGNIRIYGLKNS